MVKAIMIGAGARGADAYGIWAAENPDKLSFVAVAEPQRERREKFARVHHIAPEGVFENYEELFSHPIDADCAFVCTQDHDHYRPTMMALSRNLDVLCEKPMSGSLKECLAMAGKAREAGRTLAVCHVLRYTPFYLTVKRLLDEGKVGRILSVNEMENVCFCHFAHSFVRGSWRSAKLSNPMILAKSCHDMDILRYLVGSPCTRVASFGRLSFFTKENAPANSPDYCLDGCPAEKTCPYHCGRLYLENRKLRDQNFRSIVSTQDDDAKFLEELRHSPYGRCVFHSDNDVVDHQEVLLDFENGVTASFEMEAGTGRWGRTLSIQGTRGQIVAETESSSIVLHDFLSQEVRPIPVDECSSGHLGGDTAIVEDFVRVVEGKEESRTSAASSVESHVMALAAEEARVTGTVVSIPLFVKGLL